jgi:hypothetical protein
LTAEQLGALASQHDALLAGLSRGYPCPRGPGSEPAHREHRSR